MVLKKQIENIRYRQFIYCIFSLLTLIGGGMHSTWSSPFIPQLKSNESPINITLTTFQSSWVVSSVSIGYGVGCILAIWIFDLLGRKNCLIIGGLADILSWILIYFSNSIAMLIAARILAGASSQALINCAIIYIGEICNNDNRGKMGYLLIIFSNIGSTLCYIIGPYTPYHYFAIIAMSVSSLATFSVFFIPKSPYYLIRKNKLKEAEQAVKRLCHDAAGDTLIKQRMEEIKKCVEFDMLNKSSLKELFVNKIYRKPLFIQWGAKVLMNMSGNSIIKSYMETIIGYSGGTISTSSASVIFGVFTIASVLISSFVVDKYGRKPLLTVSSTFCGISNFALALYFYLLDSTSYNLDSISWLPLAALVAYEIFVAIGLMPIPYILGSELYPLNVKSIAVSTISLTQIPILFALQLTFETIIEHWGAYTVFWIFSCSCFVGVFYAIFILLETKGKSFTEIQECMKSHLYEMKSR